jgi:hypothetical protein
LKNNVVTCSNELTMKLTQNECLFKIHKRKDSPKNLWLDFVKKRMVRLDDRRRDRSAVAWKRKQRCRRVVFTLLSDAVVSSFLHLLCELIIVNLRRLQMILNRTIPIHAAGTVPSRIRSVGRAFTLSW